MQAKGESLSEGGHERSDFFIYIYGYIYESMHFC